MCSRLKGTASILFNTIESSRGRRNANESHKCLVLPWELHRAAIELCFRENILFKDMMTIVIRKEVIRLEDFTNPTEVSLSFTFDSVKEHIHTSAFLPNELVQSLKKVAHYTRITERIIIMNGLADYLLREYGEKYPDLVLPIKNQEKQDSK